MTIEKLKSGSYRIKQMYQGKYYYVTVPYKPTKKEALKLLSEKMDEAQETNVKNPLTFKEYAENFFEIKSNVMSPATIRGYSSILRNMQDDFKNKRLSDITNIDIQKAVNDYAENHAPKSTQNFHGFICSIMGEYRPSYHFETTLPQKVENEDYIPTDDEIKKILEMAKGTRYEIPLWLAVAGMRRSEVCAITKADLSDDNMLTINKAYVQDKDNNWIIKKYTKNSTSNRKIQLVPQVAEMIRNYPCKSDERIYQGYPSKIYYNLHLFCDRLGIQHFRLHTCRAYYVSMCHALGIPDQYIMANTGHKTDHTLKKVYRRTKSDTQKEMDKKMLIQMESFFS